ncbi:hypothetical protein TNCV_4114281 [Trichonephila clavipes]|nr:hypothetical protein TNCV_4114281 [Trichonephila clavipes]
MTLDVTEMEREVPPSHIEIVAESLCGWACLRVLQEQSELTIPDHCSHSSLTPKNFSHPPCPPRVATSRLTEAKSL